MELKIWIIIVFIKIDLGVPQNVSHYQGSAARNISQVTPSQNFSRHLAVNTKQFSRYEATPSKNVSYYQVVASAVKNSVNYPEYRDYLLVEQYNKTILHEEYGGMLHYAIYDITIGFPAGSLAIAYDITVEFLGYKVYHTIHPNNQAILGGSAVLMNEPINHYEERQLQKAEMPLTVVEGSFISLLIEYLIKNDISITLFNVTALEQQDQYFAYLEQTIQRNLDVVALFFVTDRMAEHILLEIYQNNLIRRNVILMFYWGTNKMYRYFIRNMHENMKVVVITNPRLNAYRLYYNQATSYKRHNLKLYNWWIDGKGLFHHPTLPKAFNIFKNFNGRTIPVPVIHKPPWHFVEYTNESLEVLGGRDDKLLKLLSEQLNFKYEYFDPPERIQGASFNVNGTFEGVLGLLWEREAEFFVGDVALTQERFKVVEFTCFTLADSGAFVAHAPSKLNEALALIRPFDWQVWPAIIFTVLLAGPFMYIFIAVPNFWYPRFKIRDQVEFFFDCAWYTLGIFFKQSGSAPSDSHKARFFIILLSICATYVIGDMYAANLTAMLANPGKEKPVNNLAQLEEAMKFREYKLMVERHSSSYSLLENGTGIYGRLWKHVTLTSAKPDMYLVDSVEEGMKKVRDATNVVLMAGRETLFFDIQRFGAKYFHLSEKLNTAYSSIVVQQGCPYKENFDRIIMSIFEAGILTKMTQDEYENLGKQNVKNNEDEDVNATEIPDKKKSTNKESKAKKASDDEDEGLQPINIRMLLGAFYLLCMGEVFAGLIFCLELLYSRHHIYHKRKGKKRFAAIIKIRKKIHFWSTRSINYARRKFREAMNDAIIATLEYTE